MLISEKDSGHIEIKQVLFYTKPGGTVLKYINVPYAIPKCNGLYKALIVLRIHNLLILLKIMIMTNNMKMFKLYS